MESVSTKEKNTYGKSPCTL